MIVILQQQTFEALWTSVNCPRRSIRLVRNRKAAKLIVSPALLVQADEVIE